MVAVFRATHFWGTGRVNEDTIKESMRLARMFEKQAKVVLADKSPHGGINIGTRASGTLRRLSLDLSNALADMRKPG